MLNFYLQVPNTEVIYHICASQRPLINLKTIFCASGLVGLGLLLELVIGYMLLVSMISERVCTHVCVNSMERKKLEVLNTCLWDGMSGMVW